MNQQKVAQVSNLEIRKSKIQGNGIFATKEIKKGDTILFFDGEEVNLKELLKRVFEEVKVRDEDALQIDNESYIIDLVEITRLVNHSCNPNCFIKGKNELLALRDIKKDEEITFDYSTTMDENEKERNGRKLWVCECNCKQENCRKIIGQFRDLPLEIKGYYLKNKLAPDFILKKFQKTL